jgi:1-acyl-sn-glycerol-3-phosphate acyltransferase
MSNLVSNRKTIYDNPRLIAQVRKLSFALFRWRGWRLEGSLPDLKKYVIIGAPHTSNWDFPLALGLAFCFQVKMFWMGKHTLFYWPMGYVMRWLGGIAVNRAANQNLVAQAIATMRASDELILAIPPEGTRSKVRYWKTGFYFIAHESGTPIVLAFLDYKNKVLGFGPTFMPTGDLEKDMETIRAFYAPIEGKYASQTGLAEVKAKA